jgi:hypothetical protein
MAVSGLSFPFCRALQHRVGGGDGRLGWLDDCVPAPFGEDVPVFAEVDLVGFLGGDPDGPALVYLVLPLAVVVGDLGDLQWRLRLVVAEGEAEDFERAFFAFCRIYGFVLAESSMVPSSRGCTHTSVVLWPG